MRIRSRDNPFLTQRVIAAVAIQSAPNECFFSRRLGKLIVKELFDEDPMLYCSRHRLQRRIQFEGLAFSFLAVCLLTLTWGFLQNAGLPHADIIWVAPLLIMLWGFGSALASRRYR